MSLLRAFVAVEIPPALQEAIHLQTAGLRQSLGSGMIRWVAAGNLHLTLKFLGDISPSNLDLLTQMLAAEAAQVRCFEMRIGGLGSFPNSKRPRVIWIGLDAPAPLEAMQRGLEAAAARLGYAAEERPSAPHLTIGRVKQNLSISNLQMIRTALEESKIGEIGRIHVQAIHLFKSELNPAGSIYSKLFSAPLAQET
jgi:2'-5' RNA ligase